MDKNPRENSQGNLDTLMATFQARTNLIQELVREQVSFASECINAQTRAAERLQSCRNPADYFRVPIDTSREITEEWTAMTMRQWNILLGAANGLYGSIMPTADGPTLATAEPSDTAQRPSAPASQESKSTASKQKGA